MLVFYVTCLKRLSQKRQYITWICERTARGLGRQGTKESKGTRETRVQRTIRDEIGIDT